MTTPVIHVAAALAVDVTGRALMVRKHGTTMFMQPGGKIESGEDPLDALRRELHEELGLRLPAEDFTWVGTFEEDAANEPGHRVLAEVYSVTLDSSAPVAAAEIAESRWVDPHDPGMMDLAPLSSQALLPILTGSSMATHFINDQHTVRSGTDDAPLVLLLHGYGSHEQDLPSLMPHLPPGLASAAVRAPLTVGPGAYAWVPIGVPGRPDEVVTDASTRALLAWLDEFVAPNRQIVLLGFSQGGLMVSQLLRHRPDRFLAGLVLSGFVLDATLPGDQVLADQNVPVFFGHGDADPVIAPDATARASTWLASHSALTEKSYPGLVHAISAEELADINAFLTTHLRSASA